MKSTLVISLAVFSLVACSGGGTPVDASSPGDTGGADVVAPVDATPDVLVASDVASDVAPVDGAGADTWAGWAQGFFATYCVSCHGPTTTDRARDYSQLAQVQRDTMLVACGVSSTAIAGCTASGIHPSQFPIGTGAHPSDADRARVVAWLAAGAP